jgi:hypothetical protein
MKPAPLMSRQTFLGYADDVLPPRLAQWAEELGRASEAKEVCPWLLASVLDRESLGGEALTPKGPAGTGDFGHGRGLMQIDDRAHAAFLQEVLDDGTPAWAHPAHNILYGAGVLREALNYFSKPFLALPESVAYAAGIAAYNCGPSNVRRALLEVPAFSAEVRYLAAVDSRTTGRNYSADVLRRRAAFLAQL